MLKREQVSAYDWSIEHLSGASIGWALITGSAQVMEFEASKRTGRDLKSVFDEDDGYDDDADDDDPKVSEGHRSMIIHVEGF